MLITQNVEVRSLRVQGKLRIEAPTPNSHVTVKTAFLLIDGSGADLHVDASADQSRSVTIYLRNDPAAYPDIPKMWNDPDNFNTMLTQARALAVIGEGASMVIDGFPLKHTWTLLAQTAMRGQNKIMVQDDVSDWLPGHVIAVAPTDHPSMWDFPDTGNTSWRVGPETFTVVSVRPVGNLFEITLNASIRNPYLGGVPSTGIQAEVLNLNRTVLITGDPFSGNLLPLPRIRRVGEEPPYYYQKFNTTTALVEGLHTFAAMRAVLQFRYARVERGGQRGYLGHYPVHMHYLGDCPQCEIIGLAVVDSQQRGIVIHETHRSTVRDNVLFAVRGSGIYIEEGVEIDNLIQDNVYLCHEPRNPETYLENGSWILDNSKCSADNATPDREFGDPARVFGGCRILGTDNNQADCVQHAAFWALSATNDFIGNRAVNAYNGIYFQSTLFLNGRQSEPASFHKVYPLSNPIGTIRSNVCHSCYRFGWYPDSNWPSQLNRSIETGGLVADLFQFVDNITTQYPCIDYYGQIVDGPDPTWCSARWYKNDGTDNGQTPAAIVEDGLDYGNQYMGQYNIANVQYSGHRSIHNNAAAFYLKNTKDFFDHQSSLVVDSLFEFGRADASSGIVIYKNASQNDVANAQLSLPGASAAYVIENTKLSGNMAANNITADPYNRIGSFAAAIGLNQECKWPVHDKIAHSCGPNNDEPCYSIIEGGLCNPTVVLKNVSLSGVASNAPFNNPTSWLKFGILGGNPFTGTFNAVDDSLCGNDTLTAQCRNASFRAVASKFSTHLTALPGSPCRPASFFNPTWHQRFDGGIVCAVPLRRLDIWTPYQGQDLILLPPGCSNPSQCGYRSGWLAFNDVGTKGSPPQEWAAYAEGYPFVVIAREDYHPGISGDRWTVIKADGSPINSTLVKAVEFSDLMFSVRFGRIESLVLSFPGVGDCTAQSDDKRLWITQYGAVRKGGGSCLSLWA